MIQVDFVSLFPEMIEQALSHSIVGRAAQRGLAKFRTANPRDFTHDVHRTVDDSPYGGGPGMVMKCEPIMLAVESLGAIEEAVVVLPDPTGRLFTQSMASAWSQAPRLIFLCGHYEGIDDRVRQLTGAVPVSLGDFVLTGGELPALTMADAVVRLLPGALGSSESLSIDSHSDGLLSAPQFTRPDAYRGLAVPEELTSGDHQRIAAWRRREALTLTRERRPDLFSRAPLARKDLDMLSSTA